jgi:hypothetical protein
VPLTSVSVAYLQSADEYIATKVFPKVPVANQSNLYWRYSKSDWRRTDVARRAPSTESPGVGWNVETDTYFAHVYAVHKDIDDQLRANADSNFNLDSDATKFITNQLLLKRDIDWASSYFTTGIWGTEYTGVASGPSASQFVQWDQAASTPITDVTGWFIAFKQLTGFTPNVMVIGANVMKALKNHATILDRIKYTQKGVVTEDLIAALFNIDRLLVSYATSTSTAQINDITIQDASATYSFVLNSKAALLAYAPPGPSLLTPSAGYTFTWSGYAKGNADGLRIKQFRQEAIASDRIEAEMTYDMKVVAPDMGVFLNAVVS